MEKILILSQIVIETGSGMGLFLTYLYLFTIGSFLGWVSEVLFRRFFSMHHWVNPGILKGPCLPLYGFGLCLLYTICLLCFSYLCNGEGVPSFYLISDNFEYFGTFNFGITSIIVILLVGVGMTLLEFVAGIIFIKGFNIKLWDYSSLKGNIMGIICPIFSLVWLVVGALYWFFVHPYVVLAVTFLDEHLWGITFILGAYFGLLIFDFIQSVRLAGKISNVAKKNKFVIDFQKFRDNTHLENLRKNHDKTWFSEQAEMAASKIKSKLGEMTYDIKRHMYIGNTIPEKGAAEIDETPRSKAEKLEKEGSITTKKENKEEK